MKSLSGISLLRYKHFLILSITDQIVLLVFIGSMLLIICMKFCNLFRIDKRLWLTLYLQFFSITILYWKPVQFTKDGCYVVTHSFSHDDPSSMILYFLQLLNLIPRCGWKMGITARHNFCRSISRQVLSDASYALDLIVAVAIYTTNLCCKC